MILHLLSDPDFDYAIFDQFETVNCGQNMYVVFNEKHYLLLLNKNYKINLIYYKTSKELDNVSIDGVIIHCLTWYNARLILTLDLKIPVFWSIFGTDIYSFYPHLQRMVYKKETKKYVNMANLLPELYYTARYYQRFLFSSSARDKKKAIRRINFYTTVIPSEIKFTKKILPNNAKYIRLNVGFLDFIDKEKIEAVFPKDKFKVNIYIGNSAAFTCNHLDVLDVFKKKNISNVNVTVQLSYGGTSDYVRDVIREYKKHFKDRFYALIDFVPLEKFNKLLSDQNIFIFNNIRQQGVFAIVFALWSGGKVYLSENNVTFNYYKSIGIKVFSVEKDLLEGNFEFITEPLTYEEIVKNRNIIKQEYSHEVIYKRTENVIREMRNYRSL